MNIAFVMSAERVDISKDKTSNKLSLDITVPMKNNNIFMSISKAN